MASKRRKTSRSKSRKTAKRKTAKRVKPSTKALESKIAQLEAKLSGLSKPPPPPPKPAETAPPVYEQWKQVSTSNWNDQKPKVTGYTAASDRYWASLHVQNAPDVPARNWNDQKANVTGYTAASDKYFATRQRLAYHPRNKTFQPEIAASVSGGASTQTAPPPPPPPPPEPQTQTETQTSSSKKSKQQELEDYEKEYLVRYEQQQDEATAEESAQSDASKKGAMPKGF